MMNLPLEIEKLERFVKRQQQEDFTTPAGDENSFVWSNLLLAKAVLLAAAAIVEVLRGKE